MARKRQPRDVYRGATQLQSRARSVARPVSRALWKFELNGFEQIPPDGPAILCANHISFLDSAFIMVHAPRNISFVGKSEYMDSWKTKFLFPALGMIPVDREGGEKANTALVAAEAVLRRGGGCLAFSPREREVATACCTRDIRAQHDSPSNLCAPFFPYAWWALERFSLQTQNCQRRADAFQSQSVRQFPQSVTHPELMIT